MIFSFPKFTLDIDVEKTQAYYKTAHLVSEDCSCSGCRNYEEAIELLPKEVLSFFSQLGIEMEKIREVYVNCTNTDDTVFYGGFYHVCGSIVEGESVCLTIAHNFDVSFKDTCDLLEDSFPIPAIQLEISANMPWVLAEKNDCGKTT